MNGSPTIPAKVRLLVPVLGAPIDGEALGACRAIGRTLTSAGLDFHDLAAALPIRPMSPSLGDERTATASPTHTDWQWSNWREILADVPPAYRPSRRKVHVFTPRQTADHRSMALWVRDNDRGRLSLREREFVANIVSRRRELTITQADWLGDITDRLEQGDRRAWA